MRKRLRILALVVMSAIALLPGLGRRDIVTSHEARVAQTARQMAAAGWPWSARRVQIPSVEKVRDSDGGTSLAARWDLPRMSVNPWVVPVLNGEVRLHKPPLPYWCAAMLYKVGGVEWSEGLARLTPAVLGVLATLLIYDLARMIQGRTAAWCAGLVWVSTHFVADEYRKAMADPYLAFFTLAALWAWVRAYPPDVAGRSRASFVVLFYVFVALGLLAKGPPLFLVLGIPLVLYPLCYRRAGAERGDQGPSFARVLVPHFVGVVIVMAITLPWVLAVLRAIPNALDLWRYESLGELPGGDNAEKGRPIWFYLPGLLLISLPWTVLWIVGVGGPFKRRARRLFNRRTFPVLWYLIAVLIFSLMPVKKNAYLLPSVTASVLIAAQALAALIGLLRRADKNAYLVAWIQVGLGLGLGVTMVVFAVTRVQTEKTTALALSALCLAAACGALAELRARKPRLWLWRQGLAYVLGIAVIVAFIKVDGDRARSAKAFGREVAQVAATTGEPIALEKLPEEASLYLPLNVATPRAKGRVLVIVGDTRKDLTEDAARFVERAPGGRITAVERVELSSSKANGRWKLFRLTVE